jgi:hypothetical protein
VQAASIDSWNQDNVTTEAAPRIAGEVYNSFVYTDASKTATNGGIVWAESDVQAPGMKVVVDGDGNQGIDRDAESCIMTAGVNPVDGTTKQCNDPFQTSKRFKRVSRNFDGSVDLVFDISPEDLEDPVADAVYRILEKYENLTPGRIESFTVELGTGTADGFTASIPGDGLAFTSRDGSSPPATNTGGDEGINLDALFAFGLFGDEASNDNQTVDGYYDPFNRARFFLSAAEDKIATTSISPNIAGLYGGTVGTWLAKSQAPFAFFFDADGDPLTDPITIADWDGAGQGWQTYRLCDDPIADAAGLDDSGECAVSDVNQPTGVAPAPLSAATIAAWIADRAFSVGAVEVFGNVNLNYHMTVSDDFANANSTFTLRITPVAGDDSAGAPWNDFLPWESDVEITEVRVPDSVRAGQTRTIFVTVRNNGPDEIVTGEVFIRAVNNDEDPVTIGARFTGVIDNLAAGRETRVRFRWPVPTDPQTVTWEASVEAFAAADPVPENNDATAQTTVQ